LWYVIFSLIKITVTLPIYIYIYSGSLNVDEQNLKDFAACVQSSIVRHIETRVHRAILFCDAVQKPQWKRTLVYQKTRIVVF
jgi:hypothetical protein